MFANLLPGFRDLRGPLAVGYMWLLALWLLFADYVPRKRPASSGLAANLFDLGHFLGPTLTLGVVSFMAYLLGSFLFFDPRGAIMRLPLSWLRNTLRSGRARPLGDFDPLYVGRMEAKLRIANADIYDDYDRLKAEAELRLNVAFPIAALSIVLAVQASLWYLSGIVIALVLFWQGVHRLVASEELIRQAVRAEIIQP
jgi:hypothetical protein